MMTATRQWLRRGTVLGMLILVAVMLSACIESSTTTTIGSDSTGTTKMRIGISKTALSTIAALGNSFGGTPPPTSGSAGAPPNPTDIFGDLTKQVTDMGGSATPYESADFIGVEITMQFKSLDEMVSQINNVLGNSSAGSSSPLGGSGSGSGALVTLTTSSVSDGIRIDGTIDPLSELNDPSLSSSGSSAGIPGLDLTALLAGGGKVELSITMPGKIRTTDSLAQTSGTTVSWSFKVGDQKATIFVESDKS